MSYYMYFFTRQDISPEQQLVQTAHVALQAGQYLPDDCDPSQTTFIVIGVRDLRALHAVEMILGSLGLVYTEFHEPDINNETTSIVTQPLLDTDPRREALFAFDLLKFKN